MFEHVVNPRPRGRAHWTTAALSAALHGGVLLAVLVSTLYVTDTLPEPRESITMGFAAPAPPPPRVPEPVKHTPTPTVKPARPVMTTAIIARAPVAAPIEAPSSITPETG